MQIGLGLLLFFLASQLAVVIEAIDSWHNQIFLPSQMMARYGKPGINFLYHFGLWSDMFLLPLVLCFMLAHSAKWSIGRDWLPVLIAIVLTVGNQLLLNNSPRPDPLGSKDLKWCLAIGMHDVYMAIYIAIMSHFYFNPEDVSPQAIAVVSILIGIHVAAGTHVFLGMIHLIEQWDWCPDPLSDPVLPYMSAGVWLLLSGLAWFAGGMRAGLTVAGSGAALAWMVVTFAWLIRLLVQK